MQRRCHHTEAVINDRKPCTRCLLEEAGKQDIYELIRKRIEEIAPALRTEESEYRSRLEQCRTCEHLSGGTCLKCGCYAELRAARADSYCPHENRYW